MKRSLLFTISTLFCFVIQFNSYGQTLYARATGNWNNTNAITGTWSTSDGGGSCGCMPGANDVVQISGDYVVTIPNGFHAQAQNVNVITTGFGVVFGGELVVANGGTITVNEFNLNNSSGSDVLYNATLSVNDGGEMTVNGNFNTSSSALATLAVSVRLDGILNVHGNFDPTNGQTPLYFVNVNMDIGGNYPTLNLYGTYDFSGAILSVSEANPSAVNFSGTNNHEIPTFIDYHDIIVSSTGIVELESNLPDPNNAPAFTYFYGDLIIKSNSTLDLKGLYIGETVDYDQEFKMEDGATLRIDANTANRFPRNFDRVVLHENSTVEYYGTSNLIESQSLTTNTPISYGNLLVTGNSNYILQGAITIKGDFTLEDNVRVNAQTNVITVSDADRTDKTFTLDPGSRITFTGSNDFCDGFETYNFNSTSQVVMNGTDQEVGEADQSIDPINFGDLAIRNEGTKTLIGNATIQGTCQLDYTGTTAPLIFELNKSLTGSTGTSTLELVDSDCQLDVNGTVHFPTNFNTYTFDQGSLTRMQGSNQNVGNNGTVRSSTVTIGRLQINGSDTKTLVRDVNAYGQVDVNSGTFDLDIYDLTNDNIGGDAFNLASNTTLLLGDNNGDANNANFPASYTTYALNATSTVNYDMAGAQGVLHQSPGTNVDLTYGHLEISGTNESTNIKTLQGALAGTRQIKGNVTVNSNSTFDLLSHQIDVNSTDITVQGNATLKLGGNNGDETHNMPTGDNDIDFQDNSTVNYYMNNTQTIMDESYFNLIVDGTDSGEDMKYLEESITIRGDLTINDGAHLELSNKTFTKDLTGTSSTLTAYDNGRLTVTNAFPASFNTVNLDENSTVYYNSTKNSTNDQTIKQLAYGNLVCLGGNSTKTLENDLTGANAIKGHLTVGSYTDGTNVDAAKTELATSTYNIVSSTGGKTLLLSDFAKLTLGSGVLTTPTFLNFNTVNLATTQGKESTVNYAGADQTIWTQDADGDNITGYGNVFVNGTGTKKLAGNVAVLGDFDINASTVDLDDKNIDGSTGGAGERFFMDASTTLLVGGSTDGNTANIPASFAFYNIDPTSTVNYDKAGAQGVLHQSPGTNFSLSYGNLIVSGGNTKTLQGGLDGANSRTIQGDLTVDVGTTFDLLSHQIDMLATKNAAVTNNAILRIGGNNGNNTNNMPFGYNSITFASGSTANYYMEGVQEIKDETYHHLVLDGSNQNTHFKYLDANEAIGGNLTVNDGAHLYLSDNVDFKTLSVAGTFDLNDNSSMTVTKDFPTVTGTVTLNASSTVIYNSSQIITGLHDAQTISNQTYGNLECSGGSNSIKTLEASITVAGNILVDNATELDVAGNTINYTPSSKSLTINNNAVLDLGEGVTTATTAFFGYETVTLSTAHDVESAVDFSGGNQTIWNTVDYGNVFVNGTGTKTLAGNIAVLGDFDINASTVDLDDKNVDGSTGGAGERFFMDASTTLLVGGSTDGNTANIPASFATYTLNPTSTVNYDKAGAQGVLHQSPGTNVDLTYGNLEISGGTENTDIKKLQGELTSARQVKGNLIVNSNCTFDLHAYQVDMDGNTASVASNATLKIGGNNGDNTNNMPTGYSSINFANGSTANYYMNGIQEIKDVAYHHLIVDGSDEDAHFKFLEADETISGDVTIKDGAHLHLSDNSIIKSLTGSSTSLTAEANASLTVTNVFPASFTTVNLHENSTVYYNSTLNGNATQIISQQAYGNLVCGNASRKTLAGNLTGANDIKGNLTLNASSELFTDAYTMYSANNKQLMVEDNAILDLGTGVTPATSAFFNFNDVTLSIVNGSESVVNFSGANQSIWHQDASLDFVQYGHININGSGTKALTGGNVNVYGDIIVNSGTLDVGTFKFVGEGDGSGQTFELKSNTTLLVSGLDAGDEATNNMPNNFDTYTFASNSTVNHERSGNQGIYAQTPKSANPVALSYGNIVIDGSGTKLLDGNINTIAGSVNVNAGTLDLQEHSFNSSNNSGIFTMVAGTELIVSGGTASSSNFPDNFNSYALNNTSTVLYDKEGEQGVNYESTTNSANIAYGNLILDGANDVTHIKHLLGSTSFNNVTVKEGSAFDIEEFTTTVVSNLTVEGGARLKIGESNFPSYNTLDLKDFSTVEYDKAGAQTIAAETFYNLDLTGGGTKTLSGDCGAKGIVDVEDGATFDVGTGYTNRFTFYSIGEGPTETAMLANLHDEGANGSVVGTDFVVQRKLDMTNQPNNLFGWNDWSTPLKSQLLRNWKYQDGFQIRMTGFEGSDQPWSIFNSVVTYSADKAATEGNKNDGWVGATNINDVITYKKGIRLYYGNLDRTISVMGELNEGQMEYTDLEYTSVGGDQAQSGWNLVGNPYVAPIDFSEITAENNGMVFTNLEPNFWMYSNFNKSYYAYNAASGVSNLTTYNSNITGAFESLIPSGKAFWVKATASNPQMEINEHAKRTDIGAYFVKSANKSGDGDKKVLRLMLSDLTTGGKASLAVVMLDGASYYKDKYDSGLLVNGDNQVSIYATTQDNKKVMINGVPENPKKAIPVGVKVPEERIYEISATGLENLNELSCLFLIDDITNKIYNLKEEPVIQLELSDSIIEPRFKLMFNQGPELNVETVGVGCENPNSGELHITSSENIKVNWTLVDSLDNIVAEIKEKRNAHFTGLSIGNYTLYLNGVDNSCIYSEKEIEIDNSGSTIANFETPTSTIDLASDNPEITITNTSENAAIYQWFVNGEFVSGQENLTYTFERSGNFDISLLVMNDAGTCMDVFNERIEVTNNTSINETNVSQMFRVNLTQGLLQLNNLPADINSVEVTTINGSIVKLLQTNSSSVTIDLTNQSFGVYLVSVYSDLGKKTKKILLH